MVLQNQRPTCSECGFRGHFLGQCAQNSHFELPNPLKAGAQEPKCLPGTPEMRPACPNGTQNANFGLCLATGPHLAQFGATFLIGLTRGGAPFWPSCLPGRLGPLSFIGVTRGEALSCDNLPTHQKLALPQQTHQANPKHTHINPLPQIRELPFTRTLNLEGGNLGSKTRAGVTKGGCQLCCEGGC